jgi:hypothetical protein
MHPKITDMFVNQPRHAWLVFMYGCAFVNPWQSFIIFSGLGTSPSQAAIEVVFLVVLMKSTTPV